MSVEINIVGFSDWGLGTPKLPQSLVPSPKNDKLCLITPSCLHLAHNPLHNLYTCYSLPAK